MRKLKLALTIDLINQNSRRNVLAMAKMRMSEFKEEVGAFLGLSLVDNGELCRGFTLKKYALRFERCTLDLDLVTNDTDGEMSVHSFQLR